MKIALAGEAGVRQLFDGRRLRAPKERGHFRNRHETDVLK
jgi:hypothetical protein